MDESTLLATKFEEHRPRLTALASRMLGPKTEADDAVQEGWIRFSVVLMFTFSVHGIATIEAAAEPERLATLDLVVAGGSWS